MKRAILLVSANQQRDLDMVPNTDLLNGLTMEAIAVGDCADPYNIANCIATGSLAGRKI